MKYFSPETRMRMSEAQKKRATPEDRKQRSLLRETKLPLPLVRFLYNLGSTQAEIGQLLGVSQKVVWRFMHNNALPVRRAIKRNQRTTRSSSWKGDKAGYKALHVRVNNAKGKASECSHCGTADPDKTYEWANLSGHYADINDYARLCRSCHRQYDKKRRLEVSNA